MKKTTLCLLALTLCACQSQPDVQTKTDQVADVSASLIKLSEHFTSFTSTQNIAFTYPRFTYGESLLHALPNDLSVSMPETPALSYTLAGGIGAAGGVTYVYTPEQLETIRQSPWAIENFNTDDLFPIYRKTALSEEAMRELADKILAAFNIQEQANVDYYEPADFHAEGFVLNKENRLDSTQRELYVTSNPVSLRIFQNGSIHVYLNAPYPSSLKTPYTQVGSFEDLDPNGDHEQYRTFFTQAIIAAMKGGLDQFFPFENPQLVLSEANTVSINPEVTLTINCQLHEQSDESLTLPQQLFQTAYQKLDLMFTSSDLWYVEYTPIYGEKIADVKLISVDEAIEQYNSMIETPVTINDIQAVTVSYNTDDYLYDTIPVYTLYYQETLESGEKRTISIDIPAVSINPALTYEAPMMAYELHVDPFANF